MAEFPSWRSYWSFKSEVLRNKRYFRSAETEAFLQNVAATAVSRIRAVPAGWRAWRAQLGHDWRFEEQIQDELPCAYSFKRMIPLSDRAYEGRINPKGIPCFYAATTPNTAMSEVRPWIGSHVSLAQIETVRSLRVIDCSVRHASNPIYFEEPPAEKREDAVWASIDRAFSEPTTRSDDIADYAPTQIIAEYFKSLGFDGLAYKSSFGDDGYNVALFDLGAISILSCGLYEAKAVNYSFGQVDDTWYRDN